MDLKDFIILYMIFVWVYPPAVKAYRNDLQNTPYTKALFSTTLTLSLPFVCMLSVLNKDFNAVDSQDICFIRITPSSVSEKSEDFNACLFVWSRSIHAMHQKVELVLPENLKWQPVNLQFKALLTF